MLIIHRHLVAMWLNQNDHLKVSIWHEWKMGHVPLFLTPVPLFVIPYDNIPVIAVIKSSIKAHSDMVRLVLTSLLKVHCKSAWIWIWHSADEDHLVRIDASHTRNEWYRRVVYWAAPGVWITGPSRCRVATTSTMFKTNVVHSDALLHSDVGHTMFLQPVIEVTEMCSIHRHGIVVRFNVDHDVTMVSFTEWKPSVPFLRSPRIVLTAVSYNLIVSKSWIKDKGTITSWINASSSLKRY